MIILSICLGLVAIVALVIIKRKSASMQPALAPTKKSRVFKSLLSAPAETVEALEALLYATDMGVKSTDHLMARLKARLPVEALSDRVQVLAVLKDEIQQILDSVSHAPIALEGDRPRVILFVGVNGVGKTTSIGKVAFQLHHQGKRVVMGAGDTFRAAAKEQLAIWAERAHAEIISGEAEADPSSVLYRAVTQAKETGADVVLCDTAGRLHTKVNLMEELKKVHRVLAKALPGAPHEVLLVLDATTGQNALVQARQFSEATPLTGVILTKLDGTAKGGVVIGIVEELKIPIRYLGAGENSESLMPFVAQDFVDELFA